MKYFYSLLLAALLLPLLSLAQSNYKPGYVVTLHGDTLRGYIDYKEWEQNPRNIFYRNSLTQNNVEKFTPQNCNAFSVINFEIYKRYVGNISTSKVNLSDLSTGIDTSYRTDTVFLRTIITGKNLTLYQYNDNVKNRFYVQEADKSQPYELYKNVYISNDIDGRVVESNSYKAQLIKVAMLYNTDPKNLITEIQQARYIQSDILPIVNKINNNQQAGKSLSKFGTAYFIGAGVNVNQLTFEGTISLAQANASNKASIGPKISGGIDLFQNVNVGRLILRIEGDLYASDYKVTASTTNNYLFNNTEYTRTFKQYTMAVAPQFIYNFYNKANFKFYLSAGIMANFSAYTNNKYIINTGVILYDDTYTQLKSFWLTYPLKAGVVLNKRFELYANYTPSVSITANYIAFSGNITTYNAGVHYLFGRK
ncbi:hypothetical protein HH214_02180 [Mucilaginibacter robiniae]|uniref:Outer membrane protein beta-barrel domain-containing protein n=1 Tax=Mucilaginibacter robiniae TaxID=2728022 RepID=A0A7L5E357_9SPHI|nr:hypothetical protein [Mucilaginibacter robiniae]QJD94766.1 hypothetical protein HH214_02180 [Mucilaginibacter robiniae]